MTPNNDDKTRTHVTLVQGTMVQHYRIAEKIGAGGMGEVYLAEDTKLKRRVALKFMPAHLASHEDMRTRFTREAQAAAKLDHPNIVPVYEVGQFQDRPFIAMAHIEGRSLRDVIKEGKLTVSASIELTKHICEGLQKAHEAGVVHRDVKPGNIIVDTSGRARLLDFGLATVVGEEKLTKTGSTLGTVGYMAPEQITGKQVDKRADLFSVGVILYEMITGRRPFTGDNDAAIVKAITDSMPEPIARFKSGVSGELQQIIDKALAKDPALRYQHADGLLTDLKRLRVEPVGSKKRRPVLWAATAVVLIASGYFLSTLFTGRSQTTADSEPPVLIVLPFENVGSSADQYFSVGIREEISSRLSAVKGLRVISPRSADAYQGTEKGFAQIGRETGADYVLEATVRWDKSGNVDRFRITPRLTKTSDGYLMWADNFERQLIQVFEVQSQIADQIVTALGLTLLEPDKEAPDYAPTTNMQAYNYYLRGLELMGKGIFKAQLRDAAIMFDSAVALDSGFALAWAKKSIALTQYEFGGHPSSDTKLNVAAAMAAAQRALALDPSLPEAHIALGSYYNYFENAYDSALNEFAKAKSEIASNADLSEEIGVVKMRQGKWQDALEHFQEAARIDPLTVRRYYWLFVYYSMQREYHKADQYIQSGLALAPDDPDMIYWRILLNLLEGGTPDSEDRTFEELVKTVGAARVSSNELFPSFSPGIWRFVIDRIDPSQEIANLLSGANEAVLARAYMNIGQIYQLTDHEDSARYYYDSSRTVLRQALEYQPGNFGIYSSLGLAYAYLGMADSAIWAGKKGKEVMPVDHCHW